MRIARSKDMSGLMLCNAHIKCLWKGAGGMGSLIPNLQVPCGEGLGSPAGSPGLGNPHCQYSSLELGC